MRSSKSIPIFIHFLFNYIILLTLQQPLPINAEYTTEQNIIALTDKTFEHQTQASGGMTTGSWLLLFKATKCPHCKALEPHYQRLAQDEELQERGIVFGTVDVPTNRVTSVRFGIRGFPTLIFLHKKRMYRYTGKRDYDSIKEFLIGDGDGGFKANGNNGEEIPKEPSVLEQSLKVVKAIGSELYDALMGKAGIAGYAMVVLIFIMMAILIGIVSLFFLPSKKEKDSLKSKNV